MRLSCTLNAAACERNPQNGVKMGGGRAPYSLEKQMDFYEALILVKISRWPSFTTFFKHSCCGCYCPPNLVKLTPGGLGYFFRNLISPYDLIAKLNGSVCRPICTDLKTGAQVDAVAFRSEILVDHGPDFNIDIEEFRVVLVV
mgnify:CR=1 FL=1